MQGPTKDSIFYVVGNGPSLKNYDFHSLKTRPWLGMNAAYRHWDRIGHYPTHYACLDLVVGLSHIDEIARLISGFEVYGIEQFLLDDDVADAAANIIGADNPNVVRASSVFGHDPELLRRITTGSHSVLWGATLGYQTIILLGIDQNYREEVEGLVPRGGSRLEVVSQTDSPNYYFPDYQKIGDALNRPNPIPNVHASAWRRVMRRMATDYSDTIIYNASPLSTLPGAQPIGLSNVSAEDPVSLAAPSSRTPDTVVQNENTIDITAARSLTIAQALDHLLPVRFCEIHIADPSVDVFGAGWRDVAPKAASNQGRWHLQIGQFPTDPVHPKLGSIFFVPPPGATSDWMPDGARYFDQTVRLLGEANGNLLGVLALRQDDVDPHWHRATLKPSPSARLIRSAKRLFWQSVRRLDKVRPKRTAG